MALPAEKKQFYTFSEYLALEQETNTRYMYYRGEIFDMAGGTKRHNRLIYNITSLFLNQIKNKPCAVYMNDVKLELVEDEYYVYPDVMVTCAKEEIKNDEATMIRCPVIIVEVLSDSTSSYDYQGKRLAYMKIPSLKYYLLVSQNEYYVECYERPRNNDKFWIFRSYENLNDVIIFDELNIELSIETIYQNIEINAKNANLNRNS